MKKMSFEQLVQLFSAWQFDKTELLEDEELMEMYKDYDRVSQSDVMCACFESDVEYDEVESFWWEKVWKELVKA